MKLKRLTLAAALAVAAAPFAAYTAMAEAPAEQAAEEAIPKELIVQGDCDEFGNITVGDLLLRVYYLQKTGEECLFVGCAPWEKENITEAVIPSYVRFTDTESGEERVMLVEGVGSPNIGGEKSIEDTSFDNCVNLKSVTIPDTVKYLGFRAFDGCTSLTSIGLP